MPLHYNGVKSKPSDKPSRVVERFEQPTSAEDCKKDSSFETPCRGFQKRPAVLLQRHDITSYLNRRNSLDYNGKKLKIDTNGKLVNLDLFYNKCSVNVVRNDLFKLKYAFLISSTNSDSEDSSNMSLKCKICEKVYSSEKKLQNHQENKHMIVYKPRSSKPQKRVTFSDEITVYEVKKEYHKCRKCPKIFENYNSLKTHMKLRHKKRKCYICHYCSKKFVDRMFFKVHVKLHCQMCGLLLSNKKKYVEHCRTVCRIFTLQHCKSCNEAFYKFIDLKDHNYGHLPTCFVCDICKDQCQSKCAVAHHISFLHSKRRPKSLYSMRNLGTERLYLCNFCDESSVDKDLIESHVQTLPDLSNRAMTGYKDYYFCDQCRKKFGTETAMLQHKWSHFLKTSDNSQLRPNSDAVDTSKENTTAKKEIKTIYRLDEIPEHFKPNLVLEKIKVDGKVLTETESIPFVDVKSFDVNNGEIKKPIVDPKSKKTIISKHQCQTCGKYYSSNYCLNRHIETQHSDFENLQCKVCEETFVWPSLLRSHKCIRLNIPEMPFEDARPEIHFDNINEINPNFDDLNITDSDDYMNSIDFEIPAPVVEFRECENTFVPTMNGQPSAISDGKGYALQSLGYKVIMQEVPIEF